MNNEERYSGTVIWFDSKKSIGFIRWQKNGVDQPDMFVHWTDISLEGFKTLKKEQRVSFTIGKNVKGQPKATDVQILQ